MKILVVALLISHLVNAQSEWNEGVAVLKDNQVITGKISFAHDVLLAKGENQINVLPSHKVSSFRFYDSHSNINRHYVSLPNYGSFFHTDYFYEVVVWGNTSVVRKKHHIVDPASKNKEADHFEYFVLLQQELIPLKKFRSKVYPRLQSVSTFSLAEIVAQQKLNPNLPADAIRIVQLSNKNPYDISIAGL